MRRVWCPGRVNLIGDHVDYAAGRAVPMPIDLGTTVELIGTDVAAGLPQITSADDVDPDAWAALVGAAAAEASELGGDPSTWAGHVTTTVPIGAGLSSSASLLVGLIAALGPERDPLTLARAAQRAEQAATGVAVGLMDQLCVAAGEADHALAIDFADDSHRSVAVPADVDVVVLHSGVTRRLDGTGYAIRRAATDEAARLLGGSLPRADESDVDGLPEPLRPMTRHVIGEVTRVDRFVEALAAGDVSEAGRAMSQSHRSMAEHARVSTPDIDRLVAAVARHPGVHGARLTGAGFGGCLVALTEPGAIAVDDFGPHRRWTVRSLGGVTVDP